MPNDTSHDSQIFTSWKEIAAYLGKGVRTVQRWETHLGLPVQRPNTRSKGIVRAARKDLDRWIATRWSSRSVQAKVPADHRLENEPIDSLLNLLGVGDLGTENRRLLAEIEKSLRTLRVNCRKLAPNLEVSLRLRAENSAVQSARESNSKAGPADKNYNSGSVQ